MPKLDTLLGIVYRCFQSPLSQSNRLGSDARAREVSLKDPTTRVLAFTIVGAFITIIVGVLLGYAHVESALAGTLVGYISAKTEQVVAYYFGSSAGSKSKDATIASIGGK